MDQGLKQSGVFVLGTDTEVGKTYQAAALARKLSKTSTVGVYKPVASGVLPNESDADILCEATSRLWELDRICPQQFNAPVAPPIAAEMEGRLVDEELLVEGALWWQGRCDYLIVEGAGGVLSPISRNWTVLDLAEQLRLPTVVIAANRLGVVNHCLLSWRAIEARNLAVSAIVLNSWGAEGDASVETNHRLLSKFCDLPILASLEELAVNL